MAMKAGTQSHKTIHIMGESSHGWGLHFTAPGPAAGANYAKETVSQAPHGSSGTNQRSALACFSPPSGLLAFA